MIIDCHVHFSRFGSENEGQPFPQVRDNLLTSMKTLGIRHAFVYPDSEPNTLVADLDTTRELVAGHPELLMLGTVCVPGISATAIEKQSHLAAAGDIIGIKLYPGFELFYPSYERCHAIYEMCIEHNMPVVFHSGETMDEVWREEYNHPRQIAKVAERFPTLKIMVAHFSQPHLAACRDVVLTYPNVHVDISGLAHPDVVERCGREAIAHVLREVVIQQPGKVLFGTDWPICDVGEHVTLVESLPVSEEAKNLIMSRNAERVFALGRGKGGH